MKKQLKCLLFSTYKMNLSTNRKFKLIDRSRFFLASLILLISCANLEPEMKVYGEKRFHYNFLAHEKVYLSYHLQEISGLTCLGNQQLGCVQDEDGIFYIYDFRKKEIISRNKFDSPGDFEGIESTGQKFFALKSNGDLVEFDTAQSESGIEYDTPLNSSNDVEGLCYDPANRRLLMACKGDGDYDDVKVKGKAIYAFDLDKMKMEKEGIYGIDEEDLEDFMEAVSGEDIDDVSFNPSGIAIHPIEDRIYVIASAGNLLVILNRIGEIENVVTLDPIIFRQPEGICFSAEGDLYISSEGRGMSAFIVKFEYEE